MRLIITSNSQISFRILVGELKVFKNAFHQVDESISRFLPDNSNKKDTLTNEIKCNFSCEEARILRQVLNEVCNGIDLPNFEERIGMERDRLNVIPQKIISFTRQG